LKGFVRSEAKAKARVISGQQSDFLSSRAYHAKCGESRVKEVERKEGRKSKGTSGSRVELS
jgi:hypothetical protein